VDGEMYHGRRVAGMECFGMAVLGSWVGRAATSKNNFGRGVDLWRGLFTYATGKNERALGAKHRGWCWWLRWHRQECLCYWELVGRGAADFESDLGSSAAGDIGQKAQSACVVLEGQA